MAITYLGNNQYQGLAADTKPTPANTAVNATFLETDTTKRYYNSGSAWLPIFARGAYNQIVFKEGSTYYAADINGDILNSSTTNPGAVIQTCLALRGKTFIAAGDYTLGASFAGVDIGFNFTTLDIDRRAKLIVPDGYTGYVIRVKRDATNSGQLRGCRVSGGELNEASGIGGSHLWTGAVWAGAAGTPTWGVYASSMRDVFIEYAGTGVKIDCTDGWVNGCTFDSVTASGCTTGFDFVYPTPTNPANAPSRDTFINCVVQHYDAQPTTTGFKNIGYKSHVFLNCNVWDQDNAATQKAITISGQAKNIVILGGIMTRLSSTGEYFTDNSKSTFLCDDEWHGPTYGGLTLTQHIFAPNGRKMGRQDMAGAGAGEGLLGGNMSNYTAESANADSLATADGHGGRLRTTAATINSGCGSRVSAAVTIRDYNPIYRCMFKLSQISHTRPFFGWNSATVDCPASDDPLNGLSGVILCARSTDTNFQIGSNNGSGVTTFTDTGIALDTVMRVFEIVVNEDLANPFKWNLYTVTDLESVTSNLPAYTQLTTAEIPAQSTILRPYFQMTNSEAVAKSFIQYQLYVETD
jgi:hypothetical protein